MVVVVQVNQNNNNVVRLVCQGSFIKTNFFRLNRVCRSTFKGDIRPRSGHSVGEIIQKDPFIMVNPGQNASKYFFFLLKNVTQGGYDLVSHVFNATVPGGPRGST